MNLLITGSSSGIGETVARRAVEAGHRVVLMARRADLLDTLANNLNHDRSECAISVPGDVGVVVLGKCGRHGWGGESDGTGGQ